MELNTRYIWTLKNLPGLGNKRIISILKASGEATDVPSKIQDNLRHAGYFYSIEDIEAAKSKPLPIQEDIHISTILDKDYPTRLRSLRDAPSILFIKGNKDLLEHPKSISVIGTREPSSHITTKAKELMEYLVKEQKFHIVSGLAKGCDTLAHKECLLHSGHTTAVLAHGLDYVYPSENKGLADDIISSGGCLVSEYPIGTKPSKYSFIERDRIQSGLSDYVLVLETGIKGGTMHTANFCLDQERTLLVYNHPEDLRLDDKSLGNQRLLREYPSIPISSVQDLEKAISGGSNE